MQTLHQSLVMNRRVQILARHLANLIPKTQPLKGLDVGCGSGEIALAIQQLRPHTQLKGVDVLVRRQTVIPVEAFDGHTLPYPDNHVDMVLLVDVLHHTNHPQQLLRECGRVAKQAILIKDHTSNNSFDTLRLRFMDWVGNRSHGVSLPYNYLSSGQWNRIFDELGWYPDVKRTQLSLYPSPFNYIFDGNLHFVARLKPIQAMKTDQ